MAVRPSRRRTVAGLVTVAATLAASALLTGLAPAAHATSADNGTVLGHLNALRAAHGLPGLTESSDLMSIAAAHSATMAREHDLFHNPSLTSEVANWQVLGENVGMGPNAVGIDEAFDHSPDHYANEVNTAYTQVGIGTATSSDGYLWITVDFRKPMYASAPSTPSRAVTHQPPTTVSPRHVGATRTTAATSAAASRAAAAHAAAAAREQRAAQQRARVAAVRRSAAALHPLGGTDPLAQAVDFSRTLTSMAG